MGKRLLKAIIVDDEDPSRNGLSTYIRDFCPDVAIVAECDSAKSAYEAIQKTHPDVVFLDIEMPNGSGFDLLKMFQSPLFKVIFVTAFSEYAVRAFRFSAVDYLLKPVKVDELIIAIDKVRETIHNNKPVNPGYQVLMDNLSAESGISSLVISDIKGFTVIRVSQIIKCEGEGYCTHFFLSGGKKVTSSRHLKYYEGLLDFTHIMRVHHSSLVNLRHVVGYTRQGEILLSEDLKSPLGNNYRQLFLERFGKER